MSMSLYVSQVIFTVPVIICINHLESIAHSTKYFPSVVSLLYFFCLHMLNLKPAPKKLKLFLFLDDTNLLFAHKNLKSLKKIINENSVTYITGSIQIN